MLTQIILFGAQSRLSIVYWSLDLKLFVEVLHTVSFQTSDPKRKVNFKKWGKNPRVYYVFRYEPALLNIGGGNQVLETGVSKDFQSLRLEIFLRYQGIMKTGSKLRSLSGSK